MEVTNKESRELDVLKMMGIVWRERRFVIKCCVVAGIIGCVVALNSTRTFTTVAVLAPESTDVSSMGGLGGMAASLGLSLGSASSSDAIYPDLYPNLVASTDFQVSLFDVPVLPDGETAPRSYYDHLTLDVSVPFWDYPMLGIKALIKKFKNEPDGVGDGSGPFRLSKEQMAICDALQGLVTCVVDKKSNIITIAVTDIDPAVSTVMADTVMARLQAYITDYRTKKARVDVSHYSLLAEQARKEYEQASRDYSVFADAHMNSVLTSVTTEMTRYENDMSQKYTTYTAYSTQLQAAKAKVQERTPAFTIIQRPVVPIRPSSTPKIVIAALFVILGGIGSSLWVIYGTTFKTRRKDEE